MRVDRPGPRDFKRLANIMCEALGRGYYSPEQLEELLEEDDALLLAGYDSARPVGVIVGCMLDASEMFAFEAEVMAAGGSFLFLEPMGGRPKAVGYLETICVAEQARGKGVGKALVRELELWLIERRVSWAAAHCWMNGSMGNSARLLSSCGWREVAYMPNHFLKATLQSGISCPICGDPPCLCDAKAMVKPMPAAQRQTEQLRGACADCGRRYGDEYGFPDLIIPDDAWTKISPRGNDGGLLCPSCICRRLSQQGIRCRGKFMSGPLA